MRSFGDVANITLSLHAVKQHCERWRVEARGVVIGKPFKGWGTLTFFPLTVLSELNAPLFN